MFFRAIAFVRGQSVVRILLVVRSHPCIPVDFGDDRCGGDGDADRVAIDDSFLQARCIERLGVDQKKVRLRGKLRNGREHGLVRGAADIDGVYRCRIRKSNGDRDRNAADDRVEPFAFLRGQLFAVAHSWNARAGGQNHGGGHDWPKQRSTAHFIDASNGGGSLFAR